MTADTMALLRLATRSSVPESRARTGEGTIAAIAEDQRVRNARVITSALGLLTLISVVPVLALGGSMRLAIFLVWISAGMGFAYWFARRGRLALVIPLTGACIVVEHVGSVALSGALGPVPYMAPVIILLAAAMSHAEWLWVSFVLCLAMLGLENWLSPRELVDEQAIAVACLFSAVVFVVSWLHVRSIERAFAIAEHRDQARAAAAAAALDSEERYRLIADSADDLIALVSRDGIALYLSPSHERVLGLSVSATLGELLRERLSLENMQAAKNIFEHALRDGEASGELSLRAADGRLRVLDSLMKRVDRKPEAAVAIISRDVTERRDLERRLQASERLEALGRLAGSVAHDFNNLLTVIGGSAELALGGLAETDPARADIDAVLAAARTATHLARQLLTFSRQQLVVRTQVDIGAVLRGQREVLARLLGPTIRLDYELEEALPPVFVPQAHVEQITLNLASNARDAMPGGGRLRITARRRTLADRDVGDLVAGTYVELAVSDEGTGIPGDVLPHLFEPFYSTKRGLGTGLGLATCHGIAVQAGGAIQVDTRPGRGSTFRVCFPIADAQAPAAVVPSTASELEHVLVVDDDPGVRDMTTRMLCAEGREVRTASTLDEARAILDDPRTRVDVLLTDVVIGAERGTDLILPYRKARPKLRIVVMSGYTPDPSASEIVAGQGVEFLPKPFGRDQLLRSLQGA